MPLLMALVTAIPAAGQLAPAAGRFLVAERDLSDPNFVETVVLLVEYDESGAMGLVVNWPTAAPVEELLPELEGLVERTPTIWVGGPVDRRLMLMLLRSEGDLPGADRVFADVHLSTSNELLRRVAGGELPVADLRLYSGYSGWGPGQLDRELAARGWRVMEGDAELVFAPDPDSVWPELMDRAGVRWAGRGDGGNGRVAP